MSKLVTLSLRLVERLEEMDLITEEAEEFVEDSHSKEQLPDVVPDHFGGVIGFQAAKSGRATHRDTEETVAHQAAMINEREAPNMPKAVLSHEK